MIAESKPRKEIWWFEPRWSYVPRLKKELSFLLELKMWLRILLVVALLTALLAYCVKRTMSGLDFDWTGNLALSLGGMIGALGCFFIFHWIIPPIIGVNSKGVHRHRYWLRRADIRRITIDATNPARALLKFEAAGKKPFECGISAKVSTADLADFLRAKFPEFSVEKKK